MFGFPKTYEELKQSLILYKKMRKYLNGYLSKIDINNEIIFKANEKSFTLLNLQDKRKRFNLSTIIRTWGELDFHSQATSVSSLLWKGCTLLSEFIKRPANMWNDTSYSDLHESSYSSPAQPCFIQTLISSVLNLKACFPQCRNELTRILTNFIELDKLALVARDKHEDWYSNYPNPRVMLLFQEIQTDLGQNDDKIRLEKLNVLKINVIEFAKKHLPKVELHKQTLEHYLKLG